MPWWRGNFSFLVIFFFSHCFLAEVFTVSVVLVALYCCELATVPSFPGLDDPFLSCFFSLSRLLAIPALKGLFLLVS